MSICLVHCVSVQKSQPLLTHWPNHMIIAVTADHEFSIFDKAIAFIQFLGARILLVDIQTDNICFA